MEHYRTSAHTRFDLKYHFVWITKYRKGLLCGRVGHRLRELVVEVCKTNDVEILQGHISKDHVHLMALCPPQLSPAQIMKWVKGRSSRKLQVEYPNLRKRYWGQHLWARGDGGGARVNGTGERWLDDIRNQTPPEPDDNFAVT